MSDTSPQAVYEATLKILKPALERVVADPDYRARLEAAPIDALREAGVELTDELCEELAGKRFSEFWAERREQVEGPVEIRDLPPKSNELDEQQLGSVVGGLVLGKGPVPSFAPPYVPVGPATQYGQLADVRNKIKLEDPK